METEEKEPGYLRNARPIRAKEYYDELMRVLVGGQGQGKKKEREQ